MIIFLLYFWNIIWYLISKVCIFHKYISKYVFVSCICPYKPTIHSYLNGNQDWNNKKKILKKSYRIGRISLFTYTFKTSLHSVPIMALVVTHRQVTLRCLRWFYNNKIPALHSMGDKKHALPFHTKVHCI